MTPQNHVYSAALDGLPGPIDMNVGCGHWAMYPTDSASPEEVHTALSARGFKAACVYPLEAYFYPDPQQANLRLLPRIMATDFLIGSAVINPDLPGSTADALECIKRWQVRMLRIFPGYHNFELEPDLLTDLCALAAEHGIPLAIHLRAEDQRTLNPICPVPPVSLAKVAAMALAFPQVRIIAMCALLGEVRALEGIPQNLYFDSAFIEPANSFAEAEDAPLLDKLIFGSHFPLFYAGAGLLKITGMRLSTARKARLLHDTAASLLGLKPTG